MTSPADVDVPAEGFGTRLRTAMDRLGPLCAGIDPHPGLIDQWGLHDDVEGLRTFALTAAEALVGQVAAIKPQLAFFERHGAAGLAVFEEVVAAIRGAGTPTQVIADAKRGDIGSTMAGYASAFLDPDSSLGSDAVTLSPYLGFGSLEPALSAAEAHNGGVFVLALTSNPEGPQFQHARLATGQSVAGAIVEAATARNAASDDWGPVGLVIGATIGDAIRDLDIDLSSLNGAILAPGVGAQGAGPAELEQVFGDARHYVLASTSRAVLAAGRDLGALAAAANAAAEQAHNALRA